MTRDRLTLADDDPLGDWLARVDALDVDALDGGEALGALAAVGSTP